MTPEPYAVAVGAVIFLSSFTRSTFGFGDALVAMPLLALVLPFKLAAPLVAALSLVTAVVIVAESWRRIHVASVSILVVSAFLGIPLGAFFLSVIDERIVMSVLAVVIILFALYRLASPRLVKLTNDRWAFPFGFVAGVLGGAYNTHGPPLVVYGAMRGWTADRFRASMQGYFLPTGVVVLATHAWYGRCGDAALWSYFATSLPGLLVAVFLGRWLNRRINPRRFATAIHIMLILAGIVLLSKVFFGEGPSP